MNGVHCPLKSGLCQSVQWVGLSGRVPAVMYKVPDPSRC